MTDRYLAWVQTAWGSRLSKTLSLPQPSVLQRRSDGPHSGGNVLLGGGGAKAELVSVLASTAREHLTPNKLLAADQQTRQLMPTHNAELPDNNDPPIACLIYDATGLQSLDDLAGLHHFFSTHIRMLGRGGRVMIFARPPEQCLASHRVVQRALEGFIRSLCKELRHGSTGQLIYVAEAAEQLIDSTLRFFGGTRSAYVSGQVVRLLPADKPPHINWALPLAGKKALVTGAARGIGAAIAKTLAADGAHVIGLDVPAASKSLDTQMQTLGGDSLALDITEVGAPDAICQYVKEQHQAVDIVVHNAGITRDKLLANMDEQRWQLTLDINLRAPLNINQALINGDAINDSGRIIGVSSISGIAGNAGQTNYSTSKAGIIGMVDAFAALYPDKNISCNAVAPGFIETEMTAKVPFFLRQAGRRMNSLKQGGLPVDVAETIAWMAHPASGAVNGNTVRVCGQSLLGA